ncbi:hypothetical protein SEA_INDRA_20 [Mycobacterium phage Indra]|uniref:Head-to-tail connector protein n=1 Tax=Mycobacterium phage CloudWang3 TaxID=1391430 RepID=V5R589_9CAUD|nr:head-tail connector protein [Mycobacterium phage CloudWang3]YP_008858444.1 head-tail connector protein [Mycobacterium phage Artemis2UCLA]QAY14188.1 hypothetical protein SEA_HEXAMO_20 [Mycobacterium phage Hexamo]QWT29696.1 hypothetical protein SEA_INDRA_20 [Mycobacterium phage Indra]QYC54034.1 hypothetical protein SEA_ROKSOLANA_20 [Mycobacterium phage Roksolana]AHB29810.1 hypothetical protein CLOUDWANG3_20 [Mycobacterium phage CloudWang3]AHB29913.1 hypothetical protein ARTEMIS2UCLA_20 [Myco
MRIRSKITGRIAIVSDEYGKDLIDGRGWEPVDKPKPTGSWQKKKAPAKSAPKTKPAPAQEPTNEE